MAYTISSAGIEQNNGEQLIIASSRAGWLMPVLGAAFFFVVGLVLVSSGSSLAMLVALVPLTFAVIFLTTYPTSSKVIFDFIACQVTFTMDYLIHTPRHIQFSQAFADGIQADLQQGGGLFKRNAAVLALANGVRVNMQFGSIADAENVVLRVAGLRRYAMEQNYASQQRRVGDQWVVTPPAAADQAAPQEADEQPAEVLTSEEMIQRQQAHQRAALRAQLALQLQSRTQSWTVWLVLIAVMQLVSNFQGGWPWAALLLLAAGLSLVFKDSVMFIVYAVIMGWAGVENLIFTQELLWKGFSLLQFYWTFQMIQDFRRFRKVEQIAAEPSAEPGLPPAPSRAARWFPWVSLLLGGLAFLLVAGSFVIVFGAAFFGVGNLPTGIFNSLIVLGLYIGLLGLASGIGGWAAKFPYRAASITGTIVSAITLIGLLVVNLL